MAGQGERDDGATAQLSGEAPELSAGAGIPPADDSEVLAPETRLGGRYKIVRFLARGGMGEVYEAVDTELRATLAIKTVRSHLVGDATTMERVRREVQLARVVTHPNVCRIYDLHHADVDGQRVTYITMELLEGETLRRRLRAGGPLAVEEALPLALDMLAGLDACHRVGVIHRDLKPENIVLVRREEREHAMLTDFGIARTARDEAGDEALTQQGFLVGSIAFLAPEQFDGRRATAQTDVYGLGVILWELVVGPWPLRDKDALAVMRILARDEALTDQLPPTLDPRWAATLRGCLAPVASRFPTVRDAMLALAPDAMPPRRISEPVLIPTRTATLEVATPRPRASEAEVEGLLLRLDYVAARAAAATLDVTPSARLLAVRAEVGAGGWARAVELAAAARALGSVPRRALVYFDYVTKRMAGDLEGAVAVQEGIRRSAGEDPEPTLAYVDSLIQLGRMAEATVLLDGLAARAPTPVVQARIHLGRAAVAYGPLDFVAVEVAADAAVAAAQAAAAPVIEARALAFRGLARSFLSKVDEAGADCDTAIAQLVRFQDVNGLALAYRVRSVLAFSTETDYPKALEAATQAVAQATLAKDDTLLALAESLRGNAFKEQGRIEDALAAWEASAQAAIRGLREDVANTRPRPNRASLFADLGRIDDAIAMYLEIRPRRVEPPLDVEHLTLVELYLARADLAAATAELELARVMIEATGQEVRRDQYEAQSASLALARGDDAGYRAHMTRADAASAASGAGLTSPTLARIKVAEWLGPRRADTIPKLEQLLASPAIAAGARGLVLAATGRVLAHNGRRAEAVRRQAEFRAEPMYAAYLDARVQDALLEADLAESRGQRAAAAQRLDEVQAAARAAGYVIGDWEAGLGLAELERLDGRPDAATALASAVVTAAGQAGYHRHVAAAKAILARVGG